MPENEPTQRPALAAEVPEDLPEARPTARGQGIAELALALPVIMLLVLTALDFGRAYLGWVVLNNAARVGANYAALHADAWGTPGDAAKRSTYTTLVRNARADAGATLAGCGNAAVPAPVFPSGSGLGDTAEVTVTCQFTPITPFIGGLISSGGSSITVSARSTFPIRTGIIHGPVLTPPPVCPALADFTWAVDPTDPLRVHFTDTSSGSPSGWLWAFGDGDGSALQSPSRTYASASTYAVRLDVSGCSTITQDVTVTAPEPTPGPGETPAPTASPSTTPSPTPGCTVPSFIGTKKNNAQGTWQAASFTTSITFDPDPNGNWTIEAQSLVGGQPAPCNVSITLGPNPLPGG